MFWCILYCCITSDLLESDSYGTGVSYNACRVLAQLVADGKEAWTCHSPPRSHILDKMCHAIKHHLKKPQDIFFDSLAPFLNLLPKFEHHEAQYWATWALCDLTKKDSKSHLVEGRFWTDIENCKVWIYVSFP